MSTLSLQLQVRVFFFLLRKVYLPVYSTGAAIYHMRWQRLCLLICQLFRPSDNGSLLLFGLPRAHYENQLVDKHDRHFFADFTPIKKTKALLVDFVFVLIYDQQVWSSHCTIDGVIWKMLVCLLNTLRRALNV